MCWGSSPLTRGKRQVANSVPGSRGLIPTHAGKTLFHFRTTCYAWAHPHSRGENPLHLPPRRFAAGSSPLTRGKHCSVDWLFDRSRLIPTHAGKTYCAKPVHRPCWAHPHSRGENEPSFQGHTQTRGSSPLTRGKLRSEYLRTSSMGLIPTHAGKPRAQTLRCRGGWAHPHSRGENTF